MEAEHWKLGSFDPDAGWVPVTLPNTYCREIERGVDRVAIAPASGHMQVLLSLVQPLEGPFRFVYCLLMGSAEWTPGYYSLPTDLSASELDGLLREFEEFFEQDGRHTLWVASPREKATLIYDEHNLIYGYGPLDRWMQILDQSALTPGPVSVPFPHTHHRHDGLESELHRLLASREWLIRAPFA